MMTLASVSVTCRNLSMLADISFMYPLMSLNLMSNSCTNRLCSAVETQTHRHRTAAAAAEDDDDDDDNYDDDDDALSFHVHLINQFPN